MKAMPTFGYLALGLATFTAVLATPTPQATTGEESTGISVVANLTAENSETLRPGQTIVKCKSEDDCEPQEEHSELEASLQQYPGPICRDQGQRFVSATCLNSNTLNVACFDPDDGITRYYHIHCATNEWCIQNDLNPPYAVCLDVVGLVLWRSAPEGGNAPASKSVHSTNKKVKTALGNMYYDNNGHQITVSSTSFWKEPGDNLINVVRQTNKAMDSEAIDWNVVPNVKTEVITGGAGGIQIVSFLLTK